MYKNYVQILLIKYLDFLDLLGDPSLSGLNRLNTFTTQNYSQSIHIQCTIYNVCCTCIIWFKFKHPFDTFQQLLDILEKQAHHNVNQKKIAIPFFLILINLPSSLLGMVKVWILEAIFLNLAVSVMLQIFKCCHFIFTYTKKINNKHNLLKFV